MLKVPALARGARIGLAAPVAALVVCGLPAACGGSDQAAVIGPLDGGDTTSPYPIDRGGADAPSTYKGLALRLVDRGAPKVDAVDGVIGVVCIGMSNAQQECADFIRRFDAGTYSAEVRAGVKFVNCAVGGHAIERWNDPAYDTVLWDACLDEKIPARGLRPDQIRVVWHKAATQFTTDADGAVLPPYPDPRSDFFRFQAALTTFADRLPARMPSVQAVYLSSRSYGGYAGSAARGEPLSYEQGHALNQWLERRAASGVRYGWGPYLWAPDCALGVVNGSGVCYRRTDYQADGVHPAARALEKVSTMLHERLRREDWYRR